MLCYSRRTPFNKKASKVVAKTRIEITYDNGDVHTAISYFDTLKDARAYAKTMRMKKVAEEFRIKNSPIHRSSKLYRQLLDSGKIVKGSVITKSEANKLLEELQLF
jgi:hypothetical protein